MGAGLCTPESACLTSEGQAGITSQVRWLLFGQRQFSVEEGACELWLPTLPAAGWVPQPRVERTTSQGERPREAQGGVSRSLPDLFQDGACVLWICLPPFCLLLKGLTGGAEELSRSCTARVNQSQCPRGPWGGAARRGRPRLRTHRECPAVLHAP